MKHSLYDRVERTAWGALAWGALLVALPALVLVDGWTNRAVLVGLVALTALAGGLLIHRRAQALACPLDDLAGRAERAGVAGVVFEPLHSGIDEIDRLSLVLERRASEMSRSLATERDFSSDAGHQLRTPLTALLMRLEEISASDDIDDVHSEARVAIGQVERLTAVIDELLARSRQVAGPEPSALSVDSVLASLQRELQPAFETARRSVRVGGERGLWVVASESALSQILGALFENALAHGDGTVDVIVRRSGPSVVVEVSDLGKGVDPAIAGRIFERRVSTGGTGLGLSLARDLAASNGGRLELRSISPAVFALFLSAADGPPLDRRTSLAPDLAAYGLQDRT